MRNGTSMINLRTLNSGLFEQITGCLYCMDDTENEQNIM